MEILVTSKEVRETVFSQTRISLGYNIEDVDDLLDNISESLSVYEEILSDYRELENSMSEDNRTLVIAFLKNVQEELMNSKDIINERMIETKMSLGYNQDEVDSFLDECVSALREYESRVHLL